MRPRERESVTPTHVGGLTDPEHVAREWSARGEGGKDPLEGEGLLPASAEVVIERTLSDAAFPTTRGWLMTHRGHRMIPVPGDSFLSLSQLLLRVPTDEFGSPVEVREALLDAWPGLAPEDRP